MHFFDILISKIGSNMRHFVYFYLEICFTLQGVYFFDILTFKNAPKLRCFACFDLEIWLEA